MEPLHIALLRAVNVGGTGKLPMARLREMALALGLAEPRTYIASGNLLFRSALPQAEVRSRLALALQAELGKPWGLQLRRPEDIAALLAANPFPNADGARVLVTLLDAPLPAGWEAAVRQQRDEQLQAGERALYVHYPQGAGASRLRVPAAESGTARNLNTLRAVLALAQA